MGQQPDLIVFFY